MVAAAPALAGAPPQRVRALHRAHIRADVFHNGEKQRQKQSDRRAMRLVSPHHVGNSRSEYPTLLNKRSKTISGRVWPEFRPN